MTSHITWTDVFIIDFLLSEFLVWLLRAEGVWEGRTAHILGSFCWRITKYTAFLLFFFFFSYLFVFFFYIDNDCTEGSCSDILIEVYYFPFSFFLFFFLSYDFFLLYEKGDR